MQSSITMSHHEFPTGVMNVHHRVLRRYAAYLLRNPWEILSETVVLKDRFQVHGTWFSTSLAMDVCNHVCSNLKPVGFPMTLKNEKWGCRRARVGESDFMASHSLKPGNDSEIFVVT